MTTPTPLHDLAYYKLGGETLNTVQRLLEINGSSDYVYAVHALENFARERQIPNARSIVLDLNDNLDELESTGETLRAAEISSRDIRIDLPTDEPPEGFMLLEFDDPEFLAEQETLSSDGLTSYCPDPETESGQYFLDLVRRLRSVENSFFAALHFLNTVVLGQASDVQQIGDNMVLQLIYDPRTQTPEDITPEGCTYLTREAYDALWREAGFDVPGQTEPEDTPPKASPPPAPRN